MHQRFALLASGALVAGLAISLAACGGGGSSYSPPPTGGGGNNTPTPTPTQTQGPPTAQVVKVALPTSAIGTVMSAFGILGGYTQSGQSQILGFVPGQKIEIENAQNASTGIPHTLGDTGDPSAFPNPSIATLSMTGNTAPGGNFTRGFQTGTMKPGELHGPFTLQAGTYFIGCAYHYASNKMRDVLIVAANATPGPQATPPPGQTSPPYSGGGGYGP
jgi:hypothetical protein